MRSIRVLLLVFVALSLALLVVNYNTKPESEPQPIKPTMTNPFDSRKEESEPVSIILLGDIMLGRTVTSHSLDEVGDPAYPFLKVSDKINSADLVFANLENPVVEDCPRHYSGYKFCAPPQMLEGLVVSGVDVVSLANNHSLNYGQDGYEQTKKFLDDLGISYTDPENLVVKQKNDIKVGFLGFDFLSSPATQYDYKLVSEASEKVDIMIVGVHWGVEYQNTAGDLQESIAQELIENGADVIAGHHPHWVQNWEMVNGKPVFYSLGNFIFDQMWSENTKKGVAVELVFNDKGELLENIQHNTYMNNWAQPEWVEE